MGSIYTEVELSSSLSDPSLSQVVPTIVDFVFTYIYAITPLNSLLQSLMCEISGVPL